VRRVFLDANVLFTAAHNPSGKAALVVDLGQRGHWQLFTSAVAAEEARRNLQRKFPSSAPRLADLLAAVTFHTPAGDGACPVPLAEKDRPILAAAVEVGATHFLTAFASQAPPHRLPPSTDTI
jgi:predicted nucleic acid-binding protein